LRAPDLWSALLVALVVVPLALTTVLGPLRAEGLRSEFALSTGVVGLSLLVAAFALPSRVRLLTAHLGIESVLRSHRVIAIAAVLVVVAHVALVLTGPHGLRLLDLRTAPPRARAAVAATVALVALATLAETRRRRRPRYEGWRLSHLVLASAVLLATGLHVWWLHNTVDRGLMRAWYAFLLGLLAVLLTYRWAWRPLRAVRRSYVVDEVRPAGPSTVMVALHARGHSGVPFRPGQFVWLKLGGSSFVFEEHPFTIASSAASPWRKEFTIKALGDFTELLAAMRPGRTVYVDGPHGRFTTAGLEGLGFVFIAGGVGITPMLSMLRTLADEGDQREHRLFVAGRTVEDLLHRAEIARLTRRLRLTVVEAVDRPPPGWTGVTGRLDTAVLAQWLPPPRMRRRLQYFLCGPPLMVEGLAAGLRELDVPVARIHTELFDMV